MGKKKNGEISKEDLGKLGVLTIDLLTVEPLGPPGPALNKVVSVDFKTKENNMTEEKKTDVLTQVEIDDLLDAVAEEEEKVKPPFPPLNQDEVNEALNLVEEEQAQRATLDTLTTGKPPENKEKEMKEKQTDQPIEEKVESAIGTATKTVFKTATKGVIAGWKAFHAHVLKPYWALVVPGVVAGISIAILALMGTALSGLWLDILVGAYIAYPVYRMVTLGMTKLAHKMADKLGYEYDPGEGWEKSAAVVNG